jgi:hypothetical protein
MAKNWLLKTIDLKTPRNTYQRLGNEKVPFYAFKDIWVYRKSMECS